jgi:riboflavin kinase / FMN adenylyltransferase
VRLLADMASELGFGVSIVEDVTGADGLRLSSTAVREALRAGAVEAANAMLGRAWTIEGIVVHGEKRGREIGWPTANLLLHDQLAPRHGIYVTSAILADGRVVQSVSNFGRTPTTGLRDPLLEVHLFDYAGDLYGQRIDVRFHHFLRPEARFDSLDALVAQIGADADAARAWFAAC